MVNDYPSGYVILLTAEFDRKTRMEIATLQQFPGLSVIVFFHSYEIYSFNYLFREFIINLVKRDACTDRVSSIFWYKIAIFHMKTPFAQRRTYHYLPYIVPSHHSFRYSRPDDHTLAEQVDTRCTKEQEFQKDKVRRPGLEPGFRRWQRLVITTTLSAQMRSEM